MLQALREEYRLEILSWAPVDLDAINRHFGTDLRPGEMVFHRINPLLRLLVDLWPVPASLLKTSLLLRRCRRMAGRFPILLTVNNEADFGRRGIQYIHFPWNYLPRPMVDLRWYHLTVLVRLYRWLCATLAEFTNDGVRRNLSLVNSRWTAQRVRERYGEVEMQVLYPPVQRPEGALPWEGREDGFLCLGRVSPEKELEKVVAILREVRRAGRDIHLHLAGSYFDSDYGRRIRRLAEAEGGWILLEPDLTRRQVEELMARHRYGIHGMREEHFGMAAAEMAAGGMVVFLPDGGGQVEIVGDQPLLRYASPEDAVAKILAVLDDPLRQGLLREHLLARSALFSRERFVERVREIVGGFNPR
jgi:glycosyltransferase involved in cell wall biosynthesis